MGASRDLRADLTLLAADEMFGGEQLFGSDDLVVAGGEQENRSSHHRKIDDVPERCETTRRKPVVLIKPLHDLKIIGAGEIDGARVPFAKARDQRRSWRHIIGNLQQVMNRLRFEWWMSPQLQEVRAAHASIPELHQLL